MLREVTGDDGIFVKNGDTKAKKWQAVLKTVQSQQVAASDVAALKKRVNSLVDARKEQRAAYQRGSVIIEVTSEKDELVDLYIELTEEEKRMEALTKLKKKTEEQTNLEAGKETRAAAMTTISRPESGETSKVTSDKSKRMDVREFLVSVNSEHKAHKREELQLRREAMEKKNRLESDIRDLRSCVDAKFSQLSAQNSVLMKMLEGLVASSSNKTN